MQRILVVEDDLDIQELLKNFLQEVGYEIKAMQTVQEKRIDTLVVKDLERLTRRTLDAFQIMEKLKKQGVDLICVDREPAIDMGAILFWK